MASFIEIWFLILEQFFLLIQKMSIKIFLTLLYLNSFLCNISINLFQINLTVSIPLLIEFKQHNYLILYVRKFESSTLFNVRQLQPIYRHLISLTLPSCLETNNVGNQQVNVCII